MEQTTLQQHIESQVRNGTGKEAIKEQVLAVGWSEDDFDKAYTEALIATGVPAPTATSKRYAKRASTGDVVLNFFSFILLGIVVTSLGALFFAVINVYFPDKLSNLGYGPYYYTRVTSTIHYAIAGLIVSFPLYYLSMRMWFQRFREDEAKMESKLTKWLTYLVLLVASVTIVGDLIFILFQFLQGEITSRFILKALVVLVLAGMVFGFYFLERKKIQYRNDVPRKAFQFFGYALAAMVLLGVVLGFTASGGPSTERDRRFDEQRAQDLSQLLTCVTAFAETVDRLPRSLDELSQHQRTSWCATISDPENEIPYEYNVKQELVLESAGALSGAIELCATFSLSSDEQSVRHGTYPYGSPNFYRHGAGRTCFEQSIVIKQAMYQPRAEPSMFPANF